MPPLPLPLLRNPALRVNLLETAELNRTPEDPQKVAVSLFFDDTASWRACEASSDLPAHAVVEEDALRMAFDFAPRRWMKWQYERSEWVGLSQYLLVNSTLSYPLATLRLALRRSGASSISFLESVFRSALEQEETQWVVIIKRQRSDGWKARPRLSCRTDRRLISDILAGLVNAGQMSPHQAARYRTVNATIEAGPRAYLSLDLTVAGASLDFEQVALDRLPPEVQRDVLPVVPRYVKCRFVGERVRPLWSWYAPLRPFLTSEEQAALPE